MNKSEFITTGGAAKYLNVSQQRIYAMIKEGKIKPTIIGGVKFLEYSQLDKYKK